MTDWTPYLTGGGTRPDAITGLSPGFSDAVWRLISEAPQEIRDQLRVTSGYRSNDVQSGLWENALAKYGSPEAARKWVAPPGRSRHNHGGAIDFKFLSPEAQQWVHDNAGKYGLSFPMAHEPWHVEMAGERQGTTHNALAPAATGQTTQPVDPRMNKLAALAAMPRFAPVQVGYTNSLRRLV